MLKTSKLKQTKPLKAKTPLKQTGGKKPVKSKLKTIPQLKKIADAWWSKATRYRFAYKKEGEYWAECVTCVEERPIKSLQCGHFMSRQYNSTRYLETNTAPQCYGCNVMHQGRQYEFGMALDALYGPHTAKEMHDLAKVPHQFTRDELLQIISDAKTEVDYYEKD